MNQRASGVELSDVFCATTYRVESEEGSFFLRIGQKDLALEEFLRRQSCEAWAILTAHNPGASRQCDARNEAGHALLTRRIRGLGLHDRPACNIADDRAWPEEPSLFVWPISRQAARELCSEFGQMACVCGGADAIPQLLWAGRECASMKADE